MIRSSSVLRRTVPAVGALVAAVVLSACGGVSHPGAAAVVGQDKITVSALQARMAEVRSEGAAQPAASYQEPADLAQSTVTQMVMGLVVDHALATHGQSVSATEVAQARQAEALALGGEPALDQTLLVKQQVPTEQIDAFYQQWLGMQKLAGLTGQQLGTPQGNAALSQLLAQSATELKVSVNPRYGSWDDQHAMLNGPSAAWLPPTAPAA
ncbi:hypothetical protein P3T37_005813 [Kitasatospora sp. MAA4]|uniref:hypothetical protein n=1 Tax=Kitasatospora sp. MAA4 TaxID=3035093 RepID=UPI002476FC3F|nr:hypothetical protein [Kitasatospora sp. MAA4]MDH6136388.1 hypothetical protein [Kitasatospora sp. MAA4]